MDRDIQSDSLIFGTDVKFSGAKLFSGAIDIDWIYTNRLRAREVAMAHVFHGPKYHNASNLDKTLVSEKLTDSVTMTMKLLETLDMCCSDKRIVLSIAGYGAGKSHLALTLSLLLSREPEVFSNVLDDIRIKDQSIYRRIEEILSADLRPFLVIPVNGMCNSNLKELLFSNINQILDYNDDSKECLNQFDQRYAYLSNTVRTHVRNETVLKALNECGYNTIDEFCSLMEQYDEKALIKAYGALKKNGIELYMPASRGELRDLLTSVASSLCGPGRKYRGLVIVFDEFGKYMSFAAASEAIAGPGAMQQLFEGIQSIKDNTPVVLWGLSQLDLQQYQQTIQNANYANNMNRYVTRYSIADKYYLSVCFESLLANLISKPDSITPINKGQSEKYRALLNQVFPLTMEYPLWKDEDSFLETICNGCWPLAPASVWVLTYIASVNNILQQRSGFAILNNTFSMLDGSNMPSSLFAIYPVDLFWGGLGAEFIASENSKTSPDTIATEYESVLSKYEQKLTPIQKRVLQAIVLSYKVKANCKNETNARQAISVLANVKSADVSKAIEYLSNDLNCIYFNSGLKLYEIKSDSATSIEFKRFIAEKVYDYSSKNSYDSINVTIGNILNSDSGLEQIRNEIFEDIECDFAFKHDIASVEWYYKSTIITGINYIPQTKRILDELTSKPATEYQEAKGKMIYYLLPSSIGIKQATKEISQCYESVNGMVPVMGLILHDKDDSVKNLVVELSVIEKLSTADLKKFDNIISKRKQTIIDELFHKLLDLKNEGNRIYPISVRKPRFIAGTIIFEKIFPKVIPFDIDGIRRDNSTGLKTINDFCIRFAGKEVNWNDFLKLQSKDLNRAKSLLNKGWGVFDSDGSVMKNPKHEKVKDLFRSIDDQAQGNGAFSVYKLYKLFINAPFGCNTTQATMLLFSYFAGRSSEIEFERNGQIISLSGLISEKGCFDQRTYAISEKNWSNVKFKLKINNDVKWYNLLQEWNKSKDYSECERYSQRATELSKSTRVPEQYIELLEKMRTTVLKCREKYQNWEEKGKSIESGIDENIIAKDAFALATCVADYKKQYKQILDDMPLKNLEVSQRYKSYIQKAIKILPELIEGWIADNDLSKIFDNKSLFEAREQRYNDLIKILHEINLSESEKQLADILSDKKNLFNQYKKSTQILTEVIVKCDSLNQEIEKGGINFSLAIKYRNDIEKLSDQLSGITSEAAIDSDKYVDLSSRIDSVKQKLEELIASKELQVNELIETEPKSIEELNTVSENVHKLYAFYPSDYSLCKDITQKLDALKKKIDILQKAYWDIVRNSADLHSAESAITKYREQLESQFDDEELLNHNCLFQELIKTMSERFEIKSRKWVDDVDLRVSKANSLDDYVRISNNLLALPTYLTDTDKIKAEQLMIRVDGIISKMKVDYILHLCKELNKEELEKVRKALG